MDVIAKVKCTVPIIDTYGGPTVGQVEFNVGDKASDILKDYRLNSIFRVGGKLRASYAKLGCIVIMSEDQFKFE